MRRIGEVLLTAGWLGLTSFGGPVAHIGYFREAYVLRRRWLDEDTFAGLVALCQFLPGPASSQLGITVGIRRAGLLGGFAAWLGFTLPSAAALIVFAYGVQSLGDQADSGWLHGLKVVAVAVVALALWGMARTLAPDRPRVTIAALAAIALLVAPGIAAQLAVIVGGGLLGLALLRADDFHAVTSGRAERGTPWLAVAALAGVRCAAGRAAYLPRGSSTAARWLLPTASTVRGRWCSVGGTWCCRCWRRRSCRRGGLRRTCSSRGTGRRRRCRGRCSRSRGTWARRWT